MCQMRYYLLGLPLILSILATALNNLWDVGHYRSSMRTHNEARFLQDCLGATRGLPILQAEGAHG